MIFAKPNVCGWGKTNGFRVPPVITMECSDVDTGIHWKNDQYQSSSDAGALTSRTLHLEELCTFSQTTSII